MNDCRAFSQCRDCEELADLRADLAMLVNAIEEWQEPTEGAGREWCGRFNAYLRGRVVAQSSFTPEEWARVRGYMTERDAKGDRA